MGLKFYLQGAITYSLMILKKAVKQRQKLQKKRKGAFNFRHLRNTEAAQHCVVQQGLALQLPK